jgi:hypothetical protein
MPKQVCRYCHRPIDGADLGRLLGEPSMDSDALLALLLGERPLDNETLLTLLLGAPNAGITEVGG